MCTTMGVNEEKEIHDRERMQTSSNKKKIRKFLHCVFFLFVFPLFLLDHCDHENGIGTTTASVSKRNESVERDDGAFCSRDAGVGRSAERSTDSERYRRALAH